MARSSAVVISTAAATVAVAPAATISQAIEVLAETVVAVVDVMAVVVVIKRIQVRNSIKQSTIVLTRHPLAGCPSKRSIKF
jgi:hypothetical protein